MKLLEQAELQEAELHHKTQNRWQQAQAAIYTTNKTGLVLIDTGGDVYDLLDSRIVRTAAKINATAGASLALTTCGWAAPIDDNNPENLAPSAHPQRRRVCLFIMVNPAGEMASVLRFEDTPEQTTTDDGDAKGSLAEALLELITN